MLMMMSMAFGWRWSFFKISLVHTLVVLFVFQWTLIVIAADGGIPEIKAEKESEVRVRVGHDVKLACPVESTPSLIIEWYKDGHPVDRVLDNSKLQRKSLLITNATEENEGNYVCKAVNGFGSAEVSIYLSVRGGHNEDEDSHEKNDFEEVFGGDQPGRKPEFVDHSPSHKNFTQYPEMSSVRLKCAARGNPKPEIQWLKDGKDLSIIEQDNPPRAKGWTLFIKNIQAYHKGNYTCVAHNAYGSVNTTFVLDIIPRAPRKPILTDGHPLNTSVEYGGTASFQCRVKSDALPHIQWLKKIEDSVQNGTIFFEGSLFKVLKSSEVVERNGGLYLNKLMLSEVQESDSGTYICMAANTMGYSFKSAFLTVVPNHNRWHVEDVYESVSMGKFPVTLVIVVPLLVVLMFAVVFVAFRCKQRYATPVNCSVKSATVPSATTNGTLASARGAPPPPTHVKHPNVVNSSHKMTPLLASNGSVPQWVDLPPSLHGHSNPNSTWSSQHHQAPVTGGCGSRRSGAITPNSSLRDSCSGNSTGSVPKVHHHHHYRHHHQHVYYGQDDWSSPFQC